MTRKNAGFTLTEAITAMMLIGILLSVGVPGLGYLIHKGQVSTSVSSLTMALATARISAIRSRKPVSVCPTDRQGHCRTDGIWSEGWMVYLDPKGQPQPTDAEHVLHVFSPIYKKHDLRTSQGRQRVRYQPDGRAGGSNLTFTLCDSSTALLLARLTVNNAGRTRIERPTQTLAEAPCRSTLP
ncbi:GspH/FimT family pseudopilin [Luteimonas sp. R10]|uniref:GspH/FimT family pseudopilin n=1 Tax=Luteimonas sp. R10 TaxID=3108176 RepID=UPI003086054F|nr:GspH/FimT family pseudopilin [Luteimonas sp. R10]